jgi:hypothetical protein
VIGSGNHRVLVVEFDLVARVAGDGRGVVVGDDQLEAVAVGVGESPYAIAAVTELVAKLVRQVVIISVTAPARHHSAMAAVLGGEQFGFVWPSR